MAEALVKGATTATVSKIRRLWREGEGWSIEYTWRGSPSALEDQANTLISNSTLIELGYDSNVGGNLIARFVDEDTTGDDNEATANSTWELIGQEFVRDLKTAPYFSVDNDANITSATVAIDQDMLNPPDGRVVAEYDYDDEHGSTRGNDYRDLRVKGVDSWYDFKWTIRETLEVNKESQLAASVSNVGTVVDPDVPARAKFAVDSLSLEWLKKAPTVLRVDRRRFQIMQEYSGADAWASILYTGGSG